ncbi:MAG: Hpt domain-containing protein [Burkholderiales bacterium]|nr:Hpt domain-containing protein [Burkholderiales bacterium]
MSQPTIDPAVYNELCETAGREFAAELAGTFMEEAPGMFAELRSAQAAGKADAFRRAAHSLKTNSVTFGATRLGEMARDLELGGLIAAAAPLDALEAEYRQVAAALAELARG